MSASEQTTPPARELVALLELSERATPGEWLARAHGSKQWKLRGSMLPRGGVRRCIATAGATSQYETPELDAENQANIEFIAALVNWFRATRAATVPQGVSVPDGWVLVPMEAISAAATELTFLDCAEEAANLLNAAISNFGIAAPVAWQVRHFFAGGYWSGWAQAPSEDEAKELVARHAKVGTQAEYRCLYSTTPPPAELGKGDGHV